MADLRLALTGGPPWPPGDVGHITDHEEIHKQLDGVDEREIFVSTKSWANDANTGLTRSNPVATIAQARDLLGDDPGIIRMGSGDHSCAADVLVLSGIGQHVHGLGPGNTSVVISGDGDWGAKVQHTFCSFKGFMLEAAGDLQYGVGASTPGSSGSIHDTEVCSVWVLPSGDMEAAFAFGPDHPGSSSVDLAGTKLDHCTAYADNTGVYTHAYLFGNGTSGNVLQNEAYACQAIRAQFGTSLRGAGLRWYGGGMGYITEADINVTHGSGDPIAFYAVRSEVGAMVLKQGYTGRGTSPIQLSDYNANGYDPPDNDTIINCATHLILIGGSYRTLGGNTQIIVDEFGGGGLMLEARGVGFDSDDPYRGVTASVIRNTSGTMYDDAGNPTANPGADAAGAWNAYTPTISGTGWALGNATVSARWAAVSGIVSIDISITWGSTSTFGSGPLTISFPADALPAATIGSAALRVVALDSGNNFYNLNALPSTTDFSLYAQGASGAWGAGVISTVPFTWADTDGVSISATYEAA